MLSSAGSGHKGSGGKMSAQYEVSPRTKYGKPGFAVIRTGDNGAKKVVGIWESKDAAQGIRSALAGAAAEEM